MKKSNLILALLIVITAWYHANAQDSLVFKSKYKSWVYADANDVYSYRTGVIYSVADSGINFSSAAIYSGITFIKDDRRIQYIPVSKMDYINVRKKGSIAQGALIGFGVGGVFGLILYAATMPKPEANNLFQPKTYDDMGQSAAIAIGCTIAGVAIGALIGSQKLEFEINRKQRNYKRQKAEIRSYAIIQ